MTYHCPQCGSQEISFDGLAIDDDKDGPIIPLVCEDCGWEGDSDVFRLQREYAE